MTYAGWTGSSRIFYAGGDVFAVRTSTGGTYLFNAGFLAVTNSTDASSATADTFLSRESAGVWRMGTTSTGSDAGLKCGTITASGTIYIGGNTIYMNTNGYVRLADFAYIRSGGNWGLVDIAPMTASQAGTLRLYNNLWSTTNYERLDIGQGVAGDAFIRTAAGGTGTRRNLTLDASTITASGAVMETPTQSTINPTTVNIPTGQRRGWYNSTLAEFRDWVNIGGTLLKSAAYT